MRPVFQTKFGGVDAEPGEKGDCFAACVASILELPLEEVPNFCESDYWHKDVNEWLAERGLALLTINDGAWKLCDWPMDWDTTWVIGSGLGARGHRHSVVYQGDRMVHDPYPDGDGVVLDQVDVFVVRDPARHQLKPLPSEVRCEGVGAVWCAVCGDCTCPTYEGERSLEDPGCPLHAPSSVHAEEVVDVW